MYEEKKMTVFDQMSVRTTLAESGYQEILNRPDEIKQLAFVFHSRVDAKNVLHWAARIRKLEISRLLNESLEQTKQKISSIGGEEPIFTILGLAESAVFDFTAALDDGGNEPQLLSSGLAEYIRHIEKIQGKQ